MKKVILLILWISATLYYINWRFNPDNDIIIICGIVALCKILGQILLHIDLTEKKCLLVVKLIILAIANAFIILCIWEAEKMVSAEITLSPGNINFSAIMWTAFLTILAVDIIILHAYIKEKNKTNILY